LGGLAFFALLPGLSAPLAAALGFLCARRLKRPFLCCCLAIVGSLLWGLGRFYRTPAIFGFDPFLGYFPGTIYDAEIPIPRALYFARAMHVALAAGALAWFLGRRGVGATLLGAAAVLFLFRGRLAMAPDGGDIERALGGVRVTEHFTIVYSPATLPEDELALLARDHEFRYAQLRLALGAEPAGRHITSYLFPSEEEKKTWMGAGHTYIAKPWRREVYLTQDSFPHQVLKHELAHVFAGAFGDPLFHIAMRYWPPRINVGLIEGVAVALDWRGGRELSPAGYARALGELDLRPNLADILGLGFLGQSGPRAYTVAGAFCRYLYLTYGAERLGALYRSAGDFAAIYQKPLPTLEREWEAWLAATPVTPRERELTREAMRQNAIWHRVCAHRLAELRARAADARGRGDVATAEKCLEQVARDDPDEPQNQLAMAELYAQDGRLDAAQAALSRVRAHKNSSHALLAQVEELAGDLDWRAGDSARAKASWQNALALPVDEPTERLLHARLYAASDARLQGPLLRLLLGDGKTGKHDSALDLYLIDRAVAARPDAGLPLYLLGRGLYQRHAFYDALPPLEEARHKGLPDPSFDRECLRVLGLAAYRAGDATRARAAFAELYTRPDAASGTVLEAKDWLDRLRWEAGESLAAREEGARN
jgi:hypothetical protein